MLFPAAHTRHALAKERARTYTFAVPDYNYFQRPHKGRYDLRGAMTEYAPATITLILQPTGGTQVIPRPKTVRQLLNKLDIRPTTALVIRGKELLTPDRRIETGETIIVRSVISSG